MLTTKYKYYEETTLMTMNDYDLNSQYAHWFNELFQGKPIANIRIHLNHHQINSYLRDDFYAVVAGRFRHKYSRHFIKGVRRTGKMARLLIFRHLKQGRLTNISAVPLRSSEWNEQFQTEVQKYPYMGKNRKNRFDAPHLHILAEIPEGKTIDDVKAFVFKFCNTPRRDPLSGEWIMDTMTTFYVAETRTIVGAGIYNAREGQDSLLQLM